MSDLNQTDVRLGTSGSPKSRKAHGDGVAIVPKRSLQWVRQGEGPQRVFSMKLEVDLDESEDLRTTGNPAKIE